MNYIIREAKKEDLSGILEVLKVWNMHHIPSLEVEELDLSSCFIAQKENKIIGISAYKILNKEEAKTTLLAVYPEFQGLGLGKDLQIKRLETMYEKGIKTVTTNADHIETILWYMKYFDYKEIGKLKKLCEFSLKDVSSWTTLQMDLVSYFKNKEEKEEKERLYINENDNYPLKEYSPLIINACITGMIPTKNSTKFVPISTEEIIEDAIKVCDAGARIVHLHARDETGKPTYKAKTYEKIISSIKKQRPELICCTTTSGRGWSDFEKRAEVLELTGSSKPDMASLTLGSLNFLSGASVNTISTIERLALKMKEKKIKPELEVFDYGMINIAKYLERHKILEGIKYFNIMLGNINTAQADIGNLSNMIKELPSNSIWASAGIGQYQLPMNTAAILAGGHVRVGIEDSIYYDYKKTKLASNEELVKRIVRIADELQRPIASFSQTKKLLCI